MRASFIVGLALLVWGNTRAAAQSAAGDSSIGRPGDKPVQKPPTGKADIINTLILDFFTTLNGIKYENASEDGQTAQLYFYYNATANNQLKTKYFVLRSYIFNEYGLRRYFDSLTLKTDDNVRLRNNFQVPAYECVSFQAGLDVKTQLWKTYGYRPDTADRYERYLYSDYFSPGYALYSFGGSIRFLDDASLDIGLIGGKITRIRNGRIFPSRDALTLYGLKQHERRKVEWGINLQLSIPPRMVGKHFGWELSGTLFGPRTGIGRLKSYTADASNVAHYIFFRHMRISLRTQLQFDEAVQEKIFLMNHVSLGFYVNNKL